MQKRAWSRLGAWSWCLLSSPFGAKVGVRVGRKWPTQKFSSVEMRRIENEKYGSACLTIDSSPCLPNAQRWLVLASNAFVTRSIGGATLAFRSRNETKRQQLQIRIR